MHLAVFWFGFSQKLQTNIWGAYVELVTIVNQEWCSFKEKYLGQTVTIDLAVHGKLNLSVFKFVKSWGKSLHHPHHLVFQYTNWILCFCYLVLFSLRNYGIMSTLLFHGVLQLCFFIFKTSWVFFLFNSSVNMQKMAYVVSFPGICYVHWHGVVTQS